MVFVRGMRPPREVYRHHDIGDIFNQITLVSDEAGLLGASRG